MKLKIGKYNRSKKGMVIRNSFVTFTVFSFLVIILAALPLFFQPENYASNNVASELEFKIFLWTVGASIISTFLAAMSYRTRPI